MAGRSICESLLDEAFSYLTPKEAAQLRELEAKVARGEVDLIEFYRAASGVFEIERDIAEGRPPLGLRRGEDSHGRPGR